MIDEAELRELLEEAAEYYEVPADGEARVLAAATAPPEPKPPRRRPRLTIAIASGLIALVGIFALGTVVGSQHTPPKFQSVGRQLGGASNGVSAGAGMSAGTAGGAAQEPAQPTIQPENITRAPGDDAPKVVKTGSVQIEVRKGAVGPTMTRLTSLATGFGGYVAETKSAEGADNPTGSTTLRVPVNTFENLLASVRSLGTVKSATTHGQDVTAHYVDVQSRLTAAQATLDQLYTILRKATAIGDVLAVEDRIHTTQTNIDELQGLLNVLNDQTSFAALTVDVAQHGAPLPGAAAPQSGLRKALHDARHGFTHGVETIIGHSGTALLLLLIAVALFFAVRAAWPWLRRRLV